MDHSMTGNYMAHGFCFLWEPRLVGLHVVSDVLIGIAYLSIPLAMGYFFLKRHDLPFPHLFGIFALFIFACGLTHLLAAYTVYVPAYWLEGYVKVFTALASIAAAVMLIPVIPKALGLPSLVTTMEDIKQLKGELELQLEESRLKDSALRQAQKMESIGTLAGGVAHDFNNILSAITGYGHLTLMKMPKDDPVRLYVQNILEASERAAHLTKDLLLFSMKQVTDRKPVELNEVICKVEKFLRRIIGEDIECKTVLYDGPLMVFVDAHQIEQVLMNFATNARDAMPAGGTFTIAAEKTRLDDEFIAAYGYGRPGAYALVTVSDTGQGMDEETRQRVFEPFFTTKEVGKGTGLGLAVVYGIIKQHEGYINVYSELGKGTTFRIYLPEIMSGAGEGEQETEEGPIPRGTETILLAEDDASVRGLVKSTLEEFGYTVIAAVDGEEAVNKFLKNRNTIKLLLFDLVMPKKTGKEAYDEIRKVRPDIKVIFSSGYAPDIIRQRAGINDRITVAFKPLSPRNLLKKVRRVLDGAKEGRENGKFEGGV
jgi:signal transduction histidine kinase/CheY-like chemotaxis protein